MTLPTTLREYLRNSRFIRFLYYNCHMADIPVALGIGHFRHEADKMIKQFLSEEELSNKTITESIFKDIRQCYFKYKFTPQEYFLFGLRNKSDGERKTYISDSMIMKYAADKTGRKIHDIELNDKYNFYRINKQFFKRGAVLVNRTTTLYEFSEFAVKAHRIIAKPNKAALGSGVEIFSIESNNDAQNVFEHLNASCNEYIVEELIRQNCEMAEWNQTSVNTIRINSFLSNSVFNILSPFIRTGRTGSIVDNGGQGGIFASVDKDSGIVNTNGMDEKGNTYERHPDSGIHYIGWQVPKWDELTRLVEQIHKSMPKHVYISWDFALTDNGWVLIEGNWGEFVCQQMTNNRGFKQDFLTYLNAK